MIIYIVEVIVNYGVRVILANLGAVASEAVPDPPTLQELRLGVIFTKLRDQA